MRIREVRKAKGFSGTKVAEHLGISSPYYYDLEKGKRNLGSEHLAQLADLFETTTDYLLGKSDSNLYKMNVVAEQKTTYGNGTNPEPQAVLELSDQELFERYTFKVDGVSISDEEAKGIIAFLRAKRSMK